MLCYALVCSNIVERMYDSSTGIKLTRNLDQGNRYKETFTGTAAAGKEPPHTSSATLQGQGSYLLYCLLLFGYMEAHLEPHTLGQLCTSLTIFVTVPKCFSK